MRSVGSLDFLHERRATRFGSFAKRPDNTLVQRLDAILLLLADFWLSFHESPQLENIFLNFLDINGSGDSIAACHFLNVCLQFAYILSNNFRVDNVTLVRNFRTRSCWECNYEREYALSITES
jgi:hypothetical protein